MTERIFQANLIRRLHKAYPNAIVLKTDPNYKQGIPDLLILNDSKWAALEVKKDRKASHRPNQDYYVETMDRMSFGSFISPENVEDVLQNLKKHFGG